MLLDINAETKLCGFCEPASHKSATSQSANQAASKQASKQASSDNYSQLRRQQRRRRRRQQQQQQMRHTDKQTDTSNHKHSTVQHTHRQARAYHSSGSVKRRDIQNACISLHRCAETSATAAASNSNNNATATATARDYNLCAALVQRDLAVAVTEPEIHPVDSVAEEACQ